jgi:hypothetical protein
MKWPLIGGAGRPRGRAAGCPTVSNILDREFMGPPEQVSRLQSKLGDRAEMGKGSIL